MQDMATMQQHSITSPAPASTIQNQDTPMDSIANADCDAQMHHESSRTEIGNHENTQSTTKLDNKNMKDKISNEVAPKEMCSNKSQSNEDSEKDTYKINKTEESRRNEDETRKEIIDADTECFNETVGTNSVSEDTEMKFVCPICDTVLSSQHDFTLHIRSHNNLSPETCVKSFTCKICSKVLSSSSSLDRHVLVHSGERPFKCKICGVAFTTNGNMHRHMRTHNSPASKSESYESDGSTDSSSSFHSKKSPLSPPPNNNIAKKRRVGNSIHSTPETNNNTSPPPCLSPNGSENGNKRKLPELFTENGESPGRRRKTTPSSQDSPDYSSDQSLHCPVCEREDFISIDGLEMHLEETHPEYQFRCHVCDQTFKNQRVLNLHRSMTQHGKNDRVNKNSKHTSQQKNAVLGFDDLTFVDFSSKKFPHIAVALCEKSLHKPSSTLKFQCDKCDRAFPCIGALNIHQQADCSDSEAAVDDASDRRRISSAGRSSDTAGESEEEIEVRKREDFFAVLDLQNKSVPTSPSIKSEDFISKRDDAYDTAFYYSSVNRARIDGGRSIEGGKDLADIQSILSVTSASGLIQDLSKSPPQANTMSPDCGIRGSMLDSGGGEDEQQEDCFAAEFRRMKLKGEFPCRLCKAIFPNLRALKGHNRTHISASVGIYRCNMCQYSNHDKTTLIRHMRTHNGDRPYECALCNYAFTTKANCERHLRNRHSKLSREEVKKSIIYHPSEDPTNDPDLQSKLQSRDEVKRSLIFSPQQSTSPDLSSNEHSSNFSHSTEDHGKISISEGNHSPVHRYEESRQVQSPHRSIIERVDRRVIDLKQSNAWEKTQEISPCAREDSSDQEVSHDSASERETEINENISSIEALVNLTKNNNNNTFTKLSVTENQRMSKIEIIDRPMPELPSVHHASPYQSPASDADSPLDLSMDALDLSKKKDIKSFRPSSPTKDDDNSVPQDLSKKSFHSNEYSNQRSPNIMFSTKLEQSLKGNNTLAKQLLSSNSRGTAMSPQQSQSPTMQSALHPVSGFYGNTQLNHLYLNSNGFPFSQAQTPFPLHPYFIPQTHAALMPGSNVEEIRSRLHKELINNLQLSGGTIFNSVVASAAETLQAYQQQAFQDYSRGKSEIKLSYGDVKIDENRHSTVKEIDRSTSSVVNKAPSVVKVSAAPKSSRERENSSVKMVIKNGVLMPKQKQRRYRTERPFACEHCSARFTLRSNMERHIKQQHPQYWTQRQRNNVGTGPGRRSHTIPTSLTANLNLSNHQDSVTNNQDSENSQSKSQHIPPIINIPEPPTDYEISNVIRDSFHSNKRECEKASVPKINIEQSTELLLADNAHKTKDNSSIIGNNNNNYSKAYISEEVKLAIAQQLKSKLNNPISTEQFEKRDQDDSKKCPEEDNDDESELVIDEEKEVEEEITEDKELKQETKDKFTDQTSGAVKDVDLASVSRLLDNATTQTQAFQRYFGVTQDGEEGMEGSEEEEEGLIAGSTSEGNNSGSDENKSENEQSNSNNSSSVEKKKSAYSMAPNRVSCPYCYRKFPWTSSLRRHVLTHTGQKPYKCPHCPLLFTTKSNCDRHLLRKHGGHSAPTSQGGGSPSSSETSPGSSNANYTMRNVPERPFKCNYCPSSTFSTQSNLKKHVQTKHGQASPGSAVHPFIPRTVMPGDEGCNMSTAGSSRPESRYGGDESHGSGSEDAGEERATVHLSSEGERRTGLKLQDKQERISHLSAALEGHRPPLSSTVESSVPGMKSYHSAQIALSESHTGGLSSADLPFKCHLCEGSYAERQEALDHIREHHPDEYKLLMSKGALDSNAGTEDNTVGGQPDDGNAGGGEESLEQLRGKFPDYANRKVICAFCMRRFWSAEDLRRHMRTHTGERPFSCDICRRRFTLKHSMLRHRKKHNNSTAQYNISAASTEDIAIVSGDEEHPNSGTSLHNMLQNRTRKQHSGIGEDVTGNSGDEDIPVSTISSNVVVGKPIKLALKMTNHNNNNITTTSAMKGGSHWDGETENFTATSAAKILSSKFATCSSELGDRRDDADDDNTGTDLIGNLLGIQGSIIDKVLQSKSAADEAAKLLGVQNGTNQE